MFSTQPTPAHMLHSPSPTATPASYLSHAFELPKQRYVGLLACQRDPLLHQLRSRVVSCEQSVPATPVAAKKGKKAANAEAPAVPQLWEIQLEDTVLFPEGGGQPGDQGTLVPSAADGSWAETEAAQVVDVQRRNLDAIHLATKALPVGSEVEIRVDVERRTDLMSQHTGQHLLSAILERDLQLDTLSWSLTKAPELCYVELPRAPTPEEIEKVQAACNDAIVQGTEVRVKMALAGEDGVQLGEKVPENYVDHSGERKPVMRTVEIVGLNNNPCCGTHYPSLSRLQSLYISPQTSSIRGTNARLFFAVGPRVLQSLSIAQNIVRGSSTELNCAPSEVHERLSTMRAGYAVASKNEKRLKEELAGYVADSLWTRATSQSEQEVPDAARAIVALSFREEDATNDLLFLSTVSAPIKSRLDALPKDQRALFILACGSTAGSTAPSGGALLIFGSEDLVAKAGKLVTAKFGPRVKGGGKGRWQGKLAGPSWANTDKALLQEILHEAQQE